MYANVAFLHKPHDLRVEKELRHCRNLYAGEASLVYRWIGFLVERVSDLGLMNDTVIFITRDGGFPSEDIFDLPYFEAVPDEML